jgi:methylenetetrahydrofolate reductase (NADPH)
MPSRLAARLRAREFVVTTELSAVDSADPEAVARKVSTVRGLVDAVNCTDNTGAHVHLSPLAAAHLVADAGVEPIMQLTTRDRNRLALQADLLGAAALGVRNIVAMSGDDVSAGDHPEARSIYDIDSLQLLRTAVVMRDQGTYLSGRRLADRPAFFIGAVENPFAPPREFRPTRLAKKVEAGAQFIQTQLVFDLELFQTFMLRVNEIGLLSRVFIIPSVCVIRSHRGALFMRDHVPGVYVPEALVARMAGTPPQRQAAEGIAIAVELVQQLRGMEGVAGVHLIAIKWEEGVAAVIERAHLGRCPSPLVGEGEGGGSPAIPVPAGSS